MDIEKFFTDLVKDNDLEFSFDCVDIESIDYEDAFNSILEMLEEGDAFNVEIMYHSKAMEYLTEHDNSLKDCLRLASELGYRLETLSSEVLASLLASDKARDDYNNLEHEINDFFEAIEK